MPNRMRKNVEIIPDCKHRSEVKLNDIDQYDTIRNEVAGLPPLRRRATLDLLELLLLELESKWALMSPGALGTKKSWSR